MSDGIESRLMWDLTRSAEEFTQQHHDRTIERLLLDAGRRRRQGRVRRAAGAGGLAALAAIFVTFALTASARPLQTADPPRPASSTVAGPAPDRCSGECAPAGGVPGTNTTSSSPTDLLPGAPASGVRPPGYPAAGPPRYPGTPTQTAEPPATNSAVPVGSVPPSPPSSLWQPPIWSRLHPPTPTGTDPPSSTVPSTAPPLSVPLSTTTTTVAAPATTFTFTAADSGRKKQIPEGDIVRIVLPTCPRGGPVPLESSDTAVLQPDGGPPAISYGFSTTTYTAAAPGRSTVLSRSVPGGCATPSAAFKLLVIVG